jgi:hypothetical protein
MVRGGQVMFALLLSCEPQVAASLPGCFLANDTKQLGELRPRQITRQLHTVITSSRTK